MADPVRSFSLAFVFCVSPFVLSPFTCHLSLCPSLVALCFLSLPLGPLHLLLCPLHELLSSVVALCLLSYLSPFTYHFSPCAFFHFTFHLSPITFHLVASTFTFHVDGIYTSELLSSVVAFRCLSFHLTMIKRSQCFRINQLCEVHCIEVNDVTTWPASR